MNIHGSLRELGEEASKRACFVQQPYVKATSDPDMYSTSTMDALPNNSTQEGFKHCFVQFSFRLT
jgi:hypothetical protein